MVQAVIFDCFGVLTTDTWLAFLDSLPDGVNIEAARKLNRAHNMGLVTDEDFFTGLKKITGRDAGEVQDRLTQEVAKNTTLLEYIRELRGRDYKIGLISNIASDWIRKSFLTEVEQALFDEMILSFEVGIAKPDPRMFMLACERLRVGPHEALLVDDIERYCTAARKEGLRAIVYKDFKQAKQEIEALLVKVS